MAMIFDLDNEYGGVILSDSGTGAPALRLNSNDAGQPALSILSTASANPVQFDAIDLPVRFRATATIVPAVSFGRSVNGTASIAPVRFLGASAASGAILGFQSGCISCTSIVLTSVANTDYVIPIEINGEARYIPVFKAAAVIGGAAF